MNAPLTAGRVQFREQYAADTKKGPGLSSEAFELSGGAERDRTVGLLNAIQALSQLSYSPTLCNDEVYPITARIATAKR